METKFKLMIVSSKVEAKTMVCKSSTQIFELNFQTHHYQPQSRINNEGGINGCNSEAGTSIGGFSGNDGDNESHI